MGADWGLCNVVAVTHEALVSVEAASGFCGPSTTVKPEVDVSTRAGNTRLPGSRRARMLGWIAS